MDLRLSNAYRLAVILTVFLVLAGCGRKSENPPENVHYRLKWLFNISVVGDLYAHVHGMFAEQGLQVTVKPGGPERDAIKELELGHAHFGVASADQVIRALAKGSPVVVLAQLFQANPLQWIYRPDRIRLEKPEDLKGKSVGVTFGGNDETIMRALLTRYGIRENDVTLFSVRYDYTPFYEGRVDLWPIYRNAQGVIIGEKLRKAGEPFAFFDPDSQGIRFVANSVITSRSVLEKYPETVQRFMRALLRGWRESLSPENAEKALTTLQQFDKDTSPEILRDQLKITRELMKPSEGIPFGTIDAPAWEQTEKIMLDQHLIPDPIHVKDAIKPHAGF
jgi:NitT/TauT family transport system substrate-binding protein